MGRMREAVRERERETWEDSNRCRRERVRGRQNRRESRWGTGVGEREGVAQVWERERGWGTGVRMRTGVREKPPFSLLLVLQKAYNARVDNNKIITHPY